MKPKAGKYIVLALFLIVVGKISLANEGKSKDCYSLPLPELGRSEVLITLEVTVISPGLSDFECKTPAQFEKHQKTGFGVYYVILRNRYEVLGLVEELRKIRFTPIKDEVGELHYKFVLFKDNRPIGCFYADMHGNTWFEDGMAMPDKANACWLGDFLDRVTKALLFDTQKCNEKPSQP